MVNYLAWVAKVAESERTSSGDSLECGNGAAKRERTHRS